MSSPIEIIDNKEISNENSFQLSNNSIHNYNSTLIQNTENSFSILDNNDNQIEYNEFPINISNLNYNNEINTIHYKISFSFTLIFIINVICLFHSYFPSFEIGNYSLCLWPTINKYQYYRIITNHFYHYGLYHFIFNMFTLYFSIKAIERDIGTIYSLIIILCSMILISLIYIFIIFILKVTFYSSKFNFAQQCGFSAVCFTIHTFYFQLTKNKEITFSFLFIQIMGKYSPFLLIFVFLLFIPNSSQISHLAGIVSAYLLFRLLSYIVFPRLEWIKDAERKINICNNNLFFKYIEYVSVKNEIIMKNINEFNNFWNFNFYYCVNWNYNRNQEEDNKKRKHNSNNNNDIQNQRNELQIISSE